MAETAVDEDQCGFALMIDALLVGLQHYAAPRLEQRRDVRQDLCARSARVAARVARAGTDRRLHHQLRAILAGKKLIQRRRRR